MIFAGIFIVRSSLADMRRRGRVSAVLAIVAASDVPLIFMATRWFRGVHPVAPEMEPAMRYVLLTAILSITALFAYLITRRKEMLVLSDSASELDALF